QRSAAPPEGTLNLMRLRQTGERCFSQPYQEHQGGGPAAVALMQRNKLHRQGPTRMKRNKFFLL
ncbi:hypothetical protein ILYODFUR_021113, partial [Ilyodon furcidens]